MSAADGPRVQSCMHSSNPELRMNFILLPIPFSVAPLIRVRNQHLYTVEGSSVMLECEVKPFIFISDESSRRAAFMADVCLELNEIEPTGAD